MADTDPPGNPLSVPQESRKYCESIRFGSIADAETAKNTAVSPAMADLKNQRLPERPLRKVLKFVNNDLAVFL